MNFRIHIKIVIKKTCHHPFKHLKLVVAFGKLNYWIHCKNNKMNSHKSLIYCNCTMEKNLALQKIGFSKRAWNERIPKEREKRKWEKDAETDLSIWWFGRARWELWAQNTDEPLQRSAWLQPAGVSSADSCSSAKHVSKQTNYIYTNIFMML